jgi:hypothetical protein
MILLGYGLGDGLDLRQTYLKTVVAKQVIRICTTAPVRDARPTPVAKHPVFHRRPKYRCRAASGRAGRIAVIGFRRKVA